MLNTEDVRDTRLRATLLPIQEQRGENANPMIMYICSRVFRGFERFFFFFLRDKWSPFSYSISQLQSRFSG